MLATGLLLCIARANLHYLFSPTCSAGVGAALAAGGAIDADVSGATANAANRVREGLLAPFPAARSAAAIAADEKQQQLDMARADDDAAIAVVEAIAEAEVEHAAAVAGAAQSKVALRDWLQNERTSARCQVTHHPVPR